ncbi:MAG: hypothetical protein HRT88_09085 [Lentisphaeraceae bacterium]|nr:hypothetical protein [Lentisphaeraceae bacterium]
MLEKYQKNWAQLLDKRMTFESKFAEQTLQSVRVDVEGIYIDLKKLDDKERLAFNEMILKAEV